MLQVLQVLQVLQEAGGGAGVDAVGRRRCSLWRTRQVLQGLQLLCAAVAAPAAVRHTSACVSVCRSEAAVAAAVCGGGCSGC